MIQAKSIRTFIGSPNFKVSRQFYLDLGFEEVPLGKMSYFKVNENIGFYLQDYYVKGWVDNSMVFLEVEDVEATLEDIRAKNLTQKYKGVRVSDIRFEDWGKEFFVHDPAGVLWHIGSFVSERSANAND